MERLLIVPRCPAAARSGDSAENRRLEALYNYEILDTEADARFNRVVELAADLLDMPIAAISLVDEERQWFKARLGLDMDETPRARSFCDCTIDSDELLIVEDALQDARFAEIPLVTSEPHVRFYAGAPLITPCGQRIGSLCVLDRQPRRLPERQRDILVRLASTVIDLLESYRTARLLEHKEKMLGLAELTQMEHIRYGRIFENSLTKVYLFDAQDLHLIAANRGAREKLGYEQAELEDLTPLDLMPTVGREQFERLLAPLRSGRRPRIRFQREQQRKNGTRFPAEVSIEIDLSGERPLFVAMVQDITEKLAYQRELNRALALTQSILNACQDAIATFMPLYDDSGEIRDFRCLQANAAACRMHGCSGSATIAKTLLQLWPSWAASPLFELFRRVIERAEPATIEQHYADETRDGWFRISAAPAGEGGLTLVISDITDRKQHERALQRSNEALDQFAAGVAHDLQTPIGQIGGFTTLLERHLGPDIPERAKATMGYISQAAEHMSNLVSGLLDYARLGTLMIDPEPVDLRTVVEQALAEFSEALQGATVDVSSLPEVPGNAALLRQVFQNLVGNAIKYRSDRPLAVSISARKTGSSVQIMVQDNGIGIEPHHAERIFEVFRRLHSSSSPYPGLGMGLALTKTIVEAHGGRIWLDVAPRAEEERKGSRFAIELPLPPSAATPRKASAGRSAKVLPLRKRDRGAGT